MAVTKVLCCLVRIAILSNAMPFSVLAMNSNNASNSVSNHSDSSVSLCSNVIYVPDPKDQVFEETYTYPCKETDGHSEYVKIGNSIWKCIEAYFLGGKIPRREFEDTKGHSNNNWIPATKLKEV
jgi:hypothetical protein